jgi:hypothetical protein
MKAESRFNVSSRPKQQRYKWQEGEVINLVSEADDPPLRRLSSDTLRELGVGGGWRPPNFE